MVVETPLTAAQIYEQITGGEGIQSLSDAHTDADQLTNRMVERAQRISALRAKTMAGWQGGAGDAAADATRPLVQAAADDAVHLKTAQTAVGAQMDAFGTAKHSVKPVAAQPPEMTSDDLYNVLTGDGQSYNTKVSGWQADSQGNIEAFGAYHSASTSNGGQMPSQYAQISDSGAPVSMTTSGQGTRETTTGRTATATDTGEWARNPRQTDVFGQNQDVRAGQNQIPRQPSNQVSGQDSRHVVSPIPPGGGNSDSTHADNYVPPPAAAQGGGYQFGPTGQPLGNFGSGSGNQPYSGFGPGSGGFGPGAGSGTEIGTGSGRGTSGPGTSGPGVGGYRTGSPNTGGINQRSLGSGPGSGSRVPEERMPGQAAARGTAGARGANGMPMGTAAGGRGAKDDDKEKKSAPYLKNPDPDETFGGFIEKPMPPVIGESRPKP
ncbi:hypothetical protein OHS18_33725 [Amycolatopsis sp. NBC_00355]|uniref:PPE domain-containing protein n=1 Tax=Amycolatopsis sp. NBC_00355 TaxID=2975957 RepID=UPI002E26D107